MNNPQNFDCQQYKVTVGFTQVVVQGRDRADALCAARRQLSQDAPRLWDVICNMDSSRFQVDPVS